MKQFLLFLTLFSFSFLSFSQFSLTLNGEEAFDGDTLNFYPEENEMSFVLTNTTDSDLPVACKIVSITNNADGSDVQFCWMVCMSDIAEGDVLPPSGSQTLSPGGSTAPAPANHFMNVGEGDDLSQNIEYVLLFYSLDDSGNMDMNSLIEITYVYHHAASLEDETQLAYSLYPTQVDTEFNIETQEDLTGEIITVNGAVVKEFDAKLGLNSINVSDLTTQMYFVVLTNEKGEKSLSRMIKQ